jgi:hypothetical protein
MKTRSLFLTSALLVCGAAGAQDTLLDYVVESCQADLDKYCSQVTPGDGRMMYCVAAHQDKISAKCEGALIDAAMILNDVTDQIVGVANACATELQTHCADVEVGEGRVLACLNDHDDELSDGCEVALDELVD